MSNTIFSQNEIDCINTQRIAKTATVSISSSESDGSRQGSVAIVPPGHNSWVVGEEPAVILEFAGVKEYVKGR